ncbi:hypothetical protein C8R43DRAFT_951963 [Mycena crocata]|nr:hypothetical protein C8R43DRAFT_951963 [Mycena crocata]
MEYPTEEEEYRTTGIEPDLPACNTTLAGELKQACIAHHVRFIFQYLQLIKREGFVAEYAGDDHKKMESIRTPGIEPGPPARQIGSAEGQQISLVVIQEVDLFAGWLQKKDGSE